MLLEGVIGKLSGESWKSSQSTSTRETRQTMEKELMDLSLPLSVLVGKTSLKIRDLLQLKRGDILCLDKPKDDNMVLQVGSKTKMAGKTGVVRRKKAVKITQILEREVPGSHE
jgi:flagellar motor switch protein FliM